MRFMNLVKCPENCGPPPQEFADAIEKLREEATRAGVKFLEMGGLHSSAAGARIRVSGGKLSVIDGPFTEAKEVVGGYAVFDVKSKREAIEWTSRLMQLHRDHWKGWEGESELRQLFDPADLPPGAPTR